MSLITRITHEFARRVLPAQRYMMSRPGDAAEHSPAVYLTFDDGPHPDRTNRVLDHFAACGGHGTFFVIGRNARRHPQTVRRIVAEGHSIGCHTWSHWSARRCSPMDYVEDVHCSRDIVQQITGRRINLFRPPYGELTPLALHTLLRDGFRIIHWSRDTRDFELPSVSDLAGCFAQQPLVDGDIVLMHDDCAVTSYALDRCLAVWSDDVEFHAIPMDTNSHPLNSVVTNPTEKTQDAAEPMLATVGSGAASDGWGAEL